MYHVDFFALLKRPAPRLTLSLERGDMERVGCVFRGQVGMPSYGRMLIWALDRERAISISVCMVFLELRWGPLGQRPPTAHDDLCPLNTQA